MGRAPRKQADRKVTAKGFDRRRLLVGGGAAAGLLLAWAVWPRSYRPNLNAAPGETIFNAFLKIAASGQIVVIVPQTEMGQGVTTLLPQILADELGADPYEVLSEARLDEDLNTTPLSKCELIMRLEEDFEIEIPEDEWDSLKTVQDLTDYIASRT